MIIFEEKQGKFEVIDDEVGRETIGIVYKVHNGTVWFDSDDATYLTFEDIETIYNKMNELRGNSDGI